MQSAKRQKNLFTRINCRWFFTNIPLPVKIVTTIFIRGDALILVPVVAALILSYFISVKFGLIMTGFFVALRYFGEMIYWLLQQFSDRTYRPYDFGFTRLDNNAIYIVYQLLALAWTIGGIGIAVWAALYLS